MVVRLLRFHGITDLAFLVNYKADQIMNYFEGGGSKNITRYNFLNHLPSRSSLIAPTTFSRIEASNEAFLEA